MTHWSDEDIDAMERQRDKLDQIRDAAQAGESLPTAPTPGAVRSPIGGPVAIGSLLIQTMSDGSVWKMNLDYREKFWQSLPPLPGTVEDVFMRSAPPIGVPRTVETFTAPLTLEDLERNAAAYAAASAGAD